MSSAKGLGLRLQIVLSLVGVLVLSFAPLFLAIAEVSRATLLSARERAARSLGRAVAAHVIDATGRGAVELQAVLGGHVGEGGARAVVVFDRDGTLVAAAGDPREVARVEPPARPFQEAARPRMGARGRVFDVVMPAGEAAVVVRVPTDEEAVNAAPLVRVVALYMLVFALALVTVAYAVLTRLLVRPVEELSASAGRVARGARRLDVPRRGAREIVELGRSVDAMASKLLDEERALRAKVDELVETTARLREAREQLVRSEHLASVGRLSAGLAHEIGNPLSAVAAMLELVDDPTLPEDERRDFVRRMRAETERIHGILRDLLDFARPDVGAPSERPAPCDVAAVLADLEALAGPQPAFRDLTLTLDVAPDTPRCAMGAPRLLQVLLNLALNAAHALGGREGPREIRVRARPYGDRVRIEVEDTGPGLPLEVRARAFEPFVTTKDVGEGTGLGLSVCRGLVEAASGSIELDEAYEGGARFVVTLPAAA